MTSLPKHERSRRAFAQTFERSPEQTVAAMNEAGRDIPYQIPSTPLRLQRVGVNRDAIPVLIADPFGGGKPVQVSCKINAHVDLAPDRRGIHVSRIGDLLAGLSGEAFPSLRHYAGELNRRLQAVQESRSAGVEVQGVFTYLEEVRGVKDKASLEHLELSASAEANGHAVTLSEGLGFNHITACPCVQETYRHSFQPDEAFEAVLMEKRVPLLTHTQRCRTRVTLSGMAHPPALPALLACLDAVVVRSQNTLPREFELLNVHRAHARPQFLEDVLRDLTLRVYRLLRRESTSAEGRLRIESASFESIHDFDLEGRVDLSLAELDELFGAS